MKQSSWGRWMSLHTRYLCHAHGLEQTDTPTDRYQSMITCQDQPAWCGCIFS